MIDTAIIKSEEINPIYELLLSEKKDINVKYITSLQKIKKTYDLYIIFLSPTDYKNMCIDNEKLLDKKIIIFIQEYTNKFLWNISNLFKPIDVILLTTPRNIICERLNNIINNI